VRNRIGRKVRPIGLALRKPRGRIRNLAVRRIRNDTEPGRHAITGAMRLDVEVRRRIEHLPDAGKVGLSVTVQ
jgi:hypothetical protein